GFVQRGLARLSAVHAARAGRRHAGARSAARRRSRCGPPLEIEAVARAHVAAAPATARRTGADGGGGGAARGVQAGARRAVTCGGGGEAPPAAQTFIGPTRGRTVKMTGGARAPVRKLRCGNVESNRRARAGAAQEG